MSGPFVDGRTVARRLRLQAGQLRELVTQGAVRQRPGGVYDFDEVRTAVRSNESSSLSTDLEVTDTESEDSNSRALSLSVQLCEKALGHERQMFGLYEGPIRKNFEILQEENKRLREQQDRLYARLEAAHEKQLAALESQEKLLSQAHDRELMTRAVERQEKRKDQGLELIKATIPIVGKYLRITVEQKALAQRLFASISPAQLQAIQEIEFLTAEQQGLLSALLAQQTPPTNGAAVAVASTQETPPS